MTNKERIKDVVDSIKSVKNRIKVAKEEGNLIDYRERMADLLALENCLLTECELLLKENV